MYRAASYFFIIFFVYVIFFTTFSLPLTPKIKVTILNNPFNEVEVRGYGFKRVLFLDMEAKKNITAVEWLRKQMLKGSFNYEQLFKEAEEMEREQIIEAVTYGQNNHTVSTTSDIEIAQQYYNETYGNK